MSLYADKTIKPNLSARLLLFQAARIDGFPGVITALGTLRIRGDLLVASLSHADLSDALRSYAKALHVIPFTPSSRPPSYLLSKSSTASHPHSMTSASSISDGEISPSAAVDDFEAVSTTTATPQNYQEDGFQEMGAEGGGSDTPPPLPGGQKFVVSRLFLFDRMLLVTEEVKPKRKGGTTNSGSNVANAATAADAFSQSTYQFRAAVNVNKMKFEVGPPTLFRRGLMLPCCGHKHQRL